MNVLTYVPFRSVVAQCLRTDGEQELTELSTFEQVLVAWSQVHGGFEQ